MANKDEVAGAGLGFFDKTGKLKSREEIKTDEARAAEKKRAAAEAQPQQQTDTAEFSTRDISNAFGAVKTKFVEQANQVASELNQNEDSLKKAEKIVKAQIEEARTLKEALKEGDSARAEESRRKLDELQGQREKLAVKIDTENREQAATKQSTLNLGNREVARVEVKPVEFQASSTDTAGLDKPKEVASFIDGLKNDLASLRTQEKDLRETRKTVAAAVEDVSAEIERTSGDAIREYEKAAEAANRLASQIISSARSQAFGSLSNLAGDVVRQLTGG